MSSAANAFVGAVPRIYASHLVPLLFQPYAVDLSARLRSRRLTRVLEVAAGTGVVTRQLAAELPASVSIVATDLNQAMLDSAAAIGTARPVEWRQADALQLPFGGGEFDAVVCQFGAMFFPDKAKGLSEMKRVLRPDGVCLFSVWDRLEENEFSYLCEIALARLFPDDPPRFYSRVPHGHHDRAALARDIAAAGFTAVPQFDTVVARSRAESALGAAIGVCQGTPLSAEIEARRPGGLETATRAVADEIASKFGAGHVDGKLQAIVVTIDA